MVSIVPSRFAGLKIEDDDDEEEVRPKKSSKSHNKSKTPVNQSGKKQNKPQQQQVFVKFHSKNMFFLQCFIDFSEQKAKSTEEEEDKWCE